MQIVIHGTDQTMKLPLGDVGKTEAHPVAYICTVTSLTGNEVVNIPEQESRDLVFNMIREAE